MKPPPKRKKKAASRKKKDESIRVVLECDGPTLGNLKDALVKYRSGDGLSEASLDDVALSLLQQALGDYLIEVEVQNDTDAIPKAPGNLVDTDAVDADDDENDDPEFVAAFGAYVGA
ncbi:MAG: hypothetical protein KAJ19_29770 [Gammaproteobacteria bacterium]|nr:hypothetical protein [Gammaproteobacteria bacterium]